MGLPKNIFFTNFVSNVLGQSFAMISAIASVFYISKSLGETYVGIILFIITLNLTIVGVLDKGLSNLIVKEVAENDGSQNHRIKNFLRTISFFTVFIYVFLAIIGALFLDDAIFSWLSFELADTEIQLHSVALLGSTIVLVFPSSMLISMLRGKQQMVLINVIEVTSSVVHHGGIVVTVLLIGDFAHVITYMSFSYVFKFLLLTLAVTKFFDVSYLIPWPTSAVVSVSRKFILDMSWVSIIDTVQKNLDKILLARFLHVGQFGEYAFLNSLFSRGTIITLAISNAAYPILCESYQKNNIERLQKYLRVSQDLICLINAILMVALFVFSYTAITLVFSLEVAQKLIPVAILFGLSLYLNGCLSILSRLALAVGNTRVILRYTIIAALISWPISLVFIILYGVIGGALFGVIYFLVGVFYLPVRVWVEQNNWIVRDFLIRQLKLLTLFVVVFSPVTLLVVYVGDMLSIFNAVILIIAVIVFLVVSLKMFNLSLVELKAAIET